MKIENLIKLHSWFKNPKKRIGFEHTVVLCSCEDKHMVSIQSKTLISYYILLPQEFLLNIIAPKSSNCFEFPKFYLSTFRSEYVKTLLTEKYRNSVPAQEERVKQLKEKNEATVKQVHQR